MTRTPLAIALVLVASAFAAWSPPAAAAATYEVSGKVVSDQGKPIEGALVYGHSYDRDGVGTDDKAITGPDGAFTLRLGPGKGHVNVRYEEWGTGARADVQIDGNETGLVLTLATPPPKTAIVEGRVLDTDGNPVPGAIVRLDQRCCWAYVEPMPAEPAMTPPPADAREGSGGGSTGASGATTASSPGMSIMPSPCCWDAGQETRAGPDGAYRFTTYAGLRTLTASAPGHAHATADVDAKENATVKKDITLAKVPPADAVLKGRVVDARTGAPVPNVLVSVSNLEWSRHEQAVTGADGTYTLRTLPGWSQVTVHAHAYAIPLPAEDLPVSSESGGDAASKPLSMPRPGPGPSKAYYQHLETIRLASGANALDVKLEAKPEPTVVLQGYVVDPVAKKGVADATVSVWNQDTGDWGSATTDATGSYKILVRPGHYTATSWAQGHLPGATSFVIAEGEAHKRVDLQSPEGEARYGPCDECEVRAYAADATAPPPTAGGAGSAYPKGPATSAPMAEGGARDEIATTGATPAPLPDAPRAGPLTYVGSGGGLPAYDPDQAPAPAPEQGASSATNVKNEVPAAGLVLALAALALAGLALRRRG